MVTKDLNESKPLKIVWLEVEPRHYEIAQEIKKLSGVADYRDYVLSLVFSIDGFPIRETLLHKQVMEIAAAFEEKFGPRVEGPKE